MKPYLECLSEERQSLLEDYAKAEKEYELKTNLPFDLNVTVNNAKSNNKFKTSVIMGLTGECAQIIDSLEKLYILPHEFLYLLCNTSDRVKIISENHKINFKGVKEPIHYWEIQ